MQSIHDPLISLKEAEQLIFNKIIVIPQERFYQKITRKNNNLLSVKISINNNRLFFHEKNLIIFSSLVNNFEIPILDTNLFRNHYKVPDGLISTTKVLVKDPKYVQLNMLESESLFNYRNKEFHHLRNSLLSAFLFSIGHLNQFLTFKKLLNFFVEDDIVYSALEPHFSNDDFVKIEIPNNYSTGLERLSGVLISFMKAIAASNNNLDKESIKQWGKRIITAKPETITDFLNKLQLCDEKFPHDWQSYKSFIYVLLYFAYAKEEIQNSKVFFTDDYLDKLKLNRDEVLFWKSFIKGFLSKQINNIYLIESLKEWQFNIELIAFCKVNSIPIQNYANICFHDIINESLPYDFQNLSEENKDIIAKEYFAIVSKKAKSKIERISDIDSLWHDDDKKSVKNKLYSKSLLINFCDNFKISEKLTNILKNLPENSNLKALLLINNVDYSKYDVFSLEFRQMEKDFINSLQSYFNKKVIILNTNSFQINVNDLVRNLKIIIEENSIRNVKDIFVFNSKDNLDLTKIVISAIPNIVFWDNKKPYYFVLT